VDSSRTPREKRLIVAIDGPAGSGKSTVASELARRLGVKYIDTGAMYRAITLKAMRAGVNLVDEEALRRLCDHTSIELAQEGDKLRTLLDGEDVSGPIRDPEVTRNVFYAARSPKVRAFLVAAQQRMGAQGGVVAEGRDATTVIFPNATRKVYLDARLAVRAQRRLKDLAGRQPPPSPAEVEAEMQERDQKDLTRAVGPLRRVPDALYLDTSDMSIEEVVERILAFVREGPRPQAGSP
jgi:cytidylate kinase